MPTLVEKPPEGEVWIHEVKFDGYRSQLIIDEDGTRIYTRNATTGLPIPRPRERGQEPWRPKRDRGWRNHRVEGGGTVGLRRTARGNHPTTARPLFRWFDLLHLTGHDLRDMALEERREILASMIEPGGRIQFSEPLPGEAEAIYHPLDQAGLEGMVSKRRDSKYRSGPSTNWLKGQVLFDR
ncbi:DNA ligase [Mesorhizobium sp. M0621]|uniref:ATP-dependent DNA ligase n=1 Tax=Mesorhizobium sp. M0621 TaxID=2956974 RepID=UPI0033366AB1